MTDTLALKFFYDALGVVAAYDETPVRIDVGQRVWDAVRAAGIFDKKDDWKPTRLMYQGTPIYLRRTFAEERVDVVTREERELLALLESLEVRTLRDTGVKPIAFELGASKHALYERAVRGRGILFHGIPVKQVKEKTDHVGVRYYSPPPEWAVVGACIALKDNDMLWGRIAEVDRASFRAVIRDLERETEFPVTFAELREHWQRIPDRVVPDSRFLRILGAGPVSSLDE